MKLSEFDYDLPEQQIAPHPVEPRDAARLLVYERTTGRTAHRSIRDLPELLTPGDLLVVNDTRVIPARLRGSRASGGAVELLVLGPAPGGPNLCWRALVRPAGRIRSGERIELEGGALVARAIERGSGVDPRAGAEWSFEIFDPRVPERDLLEALEENGRMPLPPYIRRARGRDPSPSEDREQYQTVFARARGAVAAPTAGLHFTPLLLERLRARGVELAAVTLHVGAGTFAPVTAEDIELHRMHAETYELLPEVAASIGRTRARGGRIVAVGTTSVRVLESCVDPSGEVRPGEGQTSIFIKPGDTFRAVDALLTNFHLPRSTLLMLVCAFAGRNRVLDLYRAAIARGYRFYSYGDAMLLL